MSRWRWSCQDYEEAIAHLTRKVEVLERRLDARNLTSSLFEDLQKAHGELVEKVGLIEPLTNWCTEALLHCGAKEVKLKCTPRDPRAPWYQKEGEEALDNAADIYWGKPRSFKPEGEKPNHGKKRTPKGKK